MNIRPVQAEGSTSCMALFRFILIVENAELTVIPVRAAVLLTMIGTVAAFAATARLRRIDPAEAIRAE